MTALALQTHARRAAPPPRSRLEDYQPRIVYTGPTMSDDIRDDRNDEEFPHRIRRGERDKMVVMAEGQVNEIAMMAAREAAKLGAKEGIKDFFRQLGVDTDDMDSVEAMRADLMAMRETRLERERRKVEFRKVLLEAVISSMRWIGYASAAYVGHLIYKDWKG